MKRFTIYFNSWWTHHPSFTFYQLPKRNLKQIHINKPAWCPGPFYSWTQGRGTPLSLFFSSGNMKTFVSLFLYLVTWRVTELNMKILILDLSVNKMAGVQESCESGLTNHNAGETENIYNCGQCCEPEAAEEPLSGTLPIRPGQGVTVLQDHSSQDTPRPTQFRAHLPWRNALRAYFRPSGTSLTYLLAACRLRSSER